MKKDSEMCCGLKLSLLAILVFACLPACRPTPTVLPTPTVEPTPTTETKPPTPTAEPTPTVEMEMSTPTVAPTPTLEGEEGLPFETIERSPSSSYEDRQPCLVVVAEASQIDVAGNMISVGAQAQLRNLDQDQYIAFIAFLGRQPYLHPGIEIQRIGCKGKAITVYAHVLELFGEVRKLVETSPYHVVSVQKGGDIQGEFEFIFNVDGVIVSQQTYHLP